MLVFDSLAARGTQVFLTLYLSTVQNLCTVFSGITVVTILGLLLNSLESEIQSTENTPSIY